MGGTTSAYAYNNANWGDKLTSYRGEDITYDEVGNPLSYYNGKRHTFTWENGRRLATATVDGVTLTFTYNDEGIRTSKTVGNTEHIYHLSGTQIITETWGHGQSVIIYLYDAEGSPIGMKYRGGNMDVGEFEEYWFEKNLQGDIVAVYDAAGTKLISYTYDAWGNFTTTYHNGCTESHIANYNPFRYRGYYYDSELGMYYLLSRYYDPVIGRYINADAYVTTGQGLLGYNMFAYCGNNPISRRDDEGQSWIIVGLAILCAVILSGCQEQSEARPAVGEGPYTNPDDAAQAFSEEVYSASSYIRHEYGTLIYSYTNNGQTYYDYTSPVVGMPHSVQLRGEKPAGATLVAYAHTHPNSNDFSGKDKAVAKLSGVNIYVVGPNLELQCFSVFTNDTHKLGRITPRTLSESEKTALVDEFKSSWEQHIKEGCDFRCKRKKWPTW